MTQKTQAQIIAEHLMPMVEKNPARTSRDKQLDLVAIEFLRQIRDGEQIVKEVTDDGEL